MDCWGQTAYQLLNVVQTTQNTRICHSQSKSNHEIFIIHFVGIAQGEAILFMHTSYVKLFSCRVLKRVKIFWKDNLCCLQKGGLVACFRVIQGWMFTSSGFWGQDQVRALLTSVPKVWRLLLVSMFWQIISPWTYRKSTLSCTKALFLVILASTLQSWLQSSWSFWLSLSEHTNGDEQSGYLEHDLGTAPKLSTTAYQVL